MFYKFLTISLLLLTTSCQEKPDKAKESTVKDIDGNVSEFAVNFTPLTTVYKKKTADDLEAFYNDKFNSRDFGWNYNKVIHLKKPLGKIQASSKIM